MYLHLPLAPERLLLQSYPDMSPTIIDMVPLRQQAHPPLPSLQ